MAAPSDGPPGFAPDQDVPIPDIAQIHAHYQAIGDATPYRWTHDVAARERGVALSRITR